MLEISFKFLHETCLFENKRHSLKQPRLKPNSACCCACCLILDCGINVSRHTPGCPCCCPRVVGSGALSQSGSSIQGKFADGLFRLQQVNPASHVLARELTGAWDGESSCRRQVNDVCLPCFAQQQCRTMVEYSGTCATPIPLRSRTPVLYSGALSLSSLFSVSFCLGFLLARTKACSISLGWRKS